MTTADPYASMEAAVAGNFKIDPSWFSALIGVESSGVPTAVSSAGAVGLGQIMPSNFQSLGLTAATATDPQSNLNASATMFSQLLAKTGGDNWLSTVYYNCGPGNVCDAGIAEANKVQQNSMSPLDYALNTPNADGGATVNGVALTGGTTAPQAQVQGAQSGPTWLQGLAARGGIIVFGVILVILAMVIPNRTMILQTASKAAG